MTNIDTLDRADLEIAILDENLIDILGGMDAVIEMETEALREALRNHIIENNEAVL